MCVGVGVCVCVGVCVGVRTYVCMWVGACVRACVCECAYPYEGKAKDELLLLLKQRNRCTLTFSPIRLS